MATKYLVTEGKGFLTTYEHLIKLKCRLFMFISAALLCFKKKHFSHIIQA